MFTNAYKYKADKAVKNKELGLQEKAVVHEFQRALKLGATDLAKRIYAANSDLKTQLDEVQAQHVTPF